MFTKNKAAFSGCLDLETRQVWLFSTNNTLTDNIAALDFEAPFGYSLRGGLTISFNDKFIGNFAKIKGI